MRNLNLIKILKVCPEGTKLYSPIFGSCKFLKIDTKDELIVVLDTIGHTWEFLSNGKFASDGEVLLFPSETNRDWSTFKVPVDKWDPDTLKPYDKVLGRMLCAALDDGWHLAFYVMDTELGIECIGGTYDVVIPYNDDTKNLLNTQNDPTEYYKWWKND